MRRMATAATIGLLGAVIGLGPARTAGADATATSVPATEIPAATFDPASTAIPSVEPSSTTTSTFPPSSTSAPTTIAASPSRPARRPLRDARAESGHTVNVSTNCTYFCFTPAQLTIDAGETVTWSNRSGAGHTLKRCDPADCDGKAAGTGTDANFGSATITLRAGGAFDYTFDQPGTYVYYCTIHGYSLMHGTITVAAAPVTDPVTTAPAVTAPPTISTGPHLASTGTRTDDAVTIAAIMLVLGLAAASAGVRRNRA